MTDQVAMPTEGERRLIIYALWRDTNCDCPRSRFKCLRCQMLNVVQRVWADDFRQVREMVEGFRVEQV